MVKVGQRLHQERMQKKLSLDDIAKATKIKPQFLLAIERGEYQKLPSPTYAQGFVRNYAAFLGLSDIEITAFFRREFDEKRAYKVLPDSLTKTKEFPITRFRIQQSLFVLTALLGLFIGYVVFQYRSVFMNPSLVLASPKDSVVTSQDVTISGKADTNATVSVNNEPVPLNNDGNFSKRLTLFPGKTAITVKAKNRFGKETVVRKNIVVKQ